MPDQNLKDLREKVASIPWCHSIDLGDGIVTPGISKTIPAGAESLPDLTGKSVLDVGAWDGYYSFLAERQGAARVVALDHYVWGVDLAARNLWWEDCKNRGILPDPVREEKDFWNDDLPGKAGFDLAHDVLGSSVESVVDDFMVSDLDKLGEFDVVIYCGVLYHMQEPLTALRRVRAVTKQVAVIETSAFHVPGYGDQSLLRFMAGDEHEADFGNWYQTSEHGLHALCRAADFKRVVTTVGPPPDDEEEAPVAPPVKARLRQAASEAKRIVTGAPPPPPPPPSVVKGYRALVHAFVD